GAQAGDQPILAVSAYRTPSYSREIQLVGFDGQRIRVDPHPPLPIDGAWSPDGSQIAFTGGERVVPTRGPSYGLDYRNIYTTDGRGANVRLIYAAPNEDENASHDPLTPSWSPDGESISPGRRTEDESCSGVTTSSMQTRSMSSDLTAVTNVEWPQADVLFGLRMAGVWRFGHRIGRDASPESMLFDRATNRRGSLRER